MSNGLRGCTWHTGRPVCASDTVINSHQGLEGPALRTWLRSQVPPPINFLITSVGLIML